ncbi:MAG TPA: UDP-N-acetylmuramoyl-L-alanine--D-glutamate ligase [Candidatus Paceibacterota bacterium]|nr:UDP-N-acetylmuramoyl-L-alanine--D-glutamate ligase [Candidatus Paceibacterota bacterium]
MNQVAKNPLKSTSFEFLSRQFLPQSSELIFTYRTNFEEAAPIEFTEKIKISSGGNFVALPESFKTAILEDLHLILGISYYKLFCPPEFKSEIKLSFTQANFWNTIYTSGLSEFLYRNNLNKQLMAQFTPDLEYERKSVTIGTNFKKVLVGIGGGKDSIIALELLKEYERTGFILETGKEYPVARAVGSLAEVPLLVTSRTLDPKIYEGIPGSYSGHLPISIIYAFIGILEAALTKQAYVVVSNEYSSSFGTVVENGEEVNHQWSKSVEFETLFQDYVKENLTADITYFSLLRPFYEIRIVEQFTKLGQKYFQTFSSCNRNFAHTHDEQRWCGECPKCAFAFLLLSVFLPPAELLKIFPRNLFEESNLIPLFKDLLGFGTMKPFDCVGTFEESQVALSLAKKEWGNTVVLQELLPLLDTITLSTEIFKVQQAKTVPTQFRFLGMKSVLILGYAREGKATEAWLKEKYPGLKVGIADQVDGPDYLDKQDEYDLTIKTAGLPGRLLKRQFTTATNMFFCAVPRQNIIGITGSKGKSTTATLIYEMLQIAGLKVRLVGNIGKPALESLLAEPVKPDELFVMELSSYQLEDLDESPKTAVLTALFPEHLDYHGTLKLYYAAKHNLVRFQKVADRFIYAPGFPEFEEWSKTHHGISEVAPTWPDLIVNKALRGDHMKANVGLAFAAAKHFGVTKEQAKVVVENFSGLPHRLMHVGTFADIEFYDDSISTTPESAIAAIKALENVDTIILGGVDRGYDFSTLEKTLREYGVRNLILFPDSGNQMIVAETGFNILRTSKMEEAVAFALAYTAKGKSCVLSPAAPSYNLYKNFEERGEAFIQVVKFLNTYSVKTFEGG